MEENYINIYSTFLAGLLDKQKLQLKDAYTLMSEFEPVCEDIKTRQDLVNFIEKYIPKYWELKELKRQLQDPNFIFNTSENNG